VLQEEQDEGPQQGVQQDEVHWQVVEEHWLELIGKEKN
jgi:hypothetical protein